MRRTIFYALTTVVVAAVLISAVNLSRLHASPPPTRMATTDHTYKLVRMTSDGASGAAQLNAAAVGGWHLATCTVDICVFEK